MPRSSQPDVTPLPPRSDNSGEAGEGTFFEEVHAELRRLARRQRKRWKGDPSLQTTALAHEAYLKLVGPEERSWESRSHFFAVAAQAMRHILVNEAEKKRAQKRGGEAPCLSMEALRERLERAVGTAGEQADEVIMAEERAELLLMLGEALDRLEAEHPRAARGVECRFFGGMTIEETAEALGVSVSTISRDWAYARGWLYREMKRIRGEEVSGAEPGI